MAWAELTDCRCFYEVDGTGEPVLLIPGLGGTGRDWAPASEALVEGLTLIRPDLRGVGRSIARRPAATLHHYSADLIELLDHLQVERAHVVGLSLGGILAQRLAMNYPERINRLVLISCAYQYGPYLREMTMLLAQAMRRFPRKLFARTMELLSCGPMHLDADPDRLERRVSEAVADPVPRRAVFRQLKALVASDPKPGEHERIVAPALIVAGEHDTIIPYCYAQQMAELIRGAHFLKLDGVGHNPFDECPELILKIIRQFLLHGIFDIHGDTPPERLGPCAA